VLKILSFNLLIISFVLVSCSKSENETPTNTELLIQLLRVALLPLDL